MRIKEAYTYKKIKLSKIFLYDENPRFEKASSEIEAIHKLVEDQGIKLIKLAEHIIDNGFSPIDIPIAIKKGKKNFVKEGNRRVACLMLVNNPNLILSNEVLKKKFLLLKSQKGHLLPRVITCALFKNQLDADKWIKLKHAVGHQGVGTEGWNSQQANRFAKLNTEDLPIELQALEILKKSGKIAKETKSLLPFLKASNLKRLLSDPYVRIKIGLEKKGNKLKLLGPKAKSLKNLEIVIHEISKKGFVVDKIYHRKDKKKFIDSIKLKKIKITSFLSGGIPVTSKMTPSYTSLIDPNKNSPEGINSKILNIYKELQVISVDIAPHATALLLRVIIEISVKTYLKKKKISIDSYDIAHAVISGKQIKLSSLNEKIDFIAKTYITKDSDLKKSVMLLNKNSFSKTLNQVVHSDVHQSTPTIVREFWINAENLFIFLVA